jgi:hypothetical protein
MQRWKIERFHYVLKSGCAIEKLQERSIEKTTTLILMYSIIAVMILNMTYAARLTPELPGSLFGGRGVETAVLCGEQGEERTGEAVHDKRSGRLPGTAGRAETCSK